ncbi:zinc finger, PHD-type [Artemisia annua]|uniref:Zinc finger, PHD-type n=1 Tax=Artemisia annua TaxID=35608 RepID=A0A2U1M725_ARTAN|nr:zinc finger, PHD-type [Artemisia annua]
MMPNNQIKMQTTSIKPMSSLGKEEEVISPKLDGDEKPSADVAVVADVACGGDEVRDSVKGDGVDDVACGGGELTDSVKADGVADVACGGNSELTETVKVDEEVISPKLDDGEKPSADVAVVADVACGGDELTDSVKADGVADDVACGGDELTDSVKVDGVSDVACGGDSELTDSVKTDGVECEETVADDVACGGNSELTDSGKVDGKECGESGVADDVACGGNSELTESVKFDGVADVARGGNSELTDSVKINGVECEKTGVDDVACGGNSELTKECEDKIIGESEPEGVKMDVTNDIEVAKGGEAVTEGQNDAVEGVAAELVADDVVKQNDEGDDMVTDRKDDVNEGVKAELVADDVVKQNDKGDDMVTDRKDDVNEGVEAEIVADKEEGKMDVVEKQNDDEEEEVEAVKRRGRPRKREGSPAVATPSSKKRRGRPKKNGGNSAKATPKSTSVKMVEKEEEAENKDVETKSPDLPIKRRGRGRPKKSEGNSAKAAPKSTSVKMIEEDEDVEAVETELPDAPVKKLGRPRKSGGNSQKATPKSASAKMIEKKKEEEDVCFICFDGGELVLCDKKDCPKAYHHSCVDRDEAFFQTKGNWNCGEEEEKKGFCEPCMKIVMLIENKSQETQEGVDFDDKDSWEYMFKEYWTDLKPKLNISLAELLEAKTACKGSSPAGEQEPPAVHSDGGSGSENPSENPESQTKKKSRKSKKQKTIDSAVIASEGTPVPESENTEWATEELLEFVAHMGNNNKSYQSQFDVQALLLEYIKTNKLRDPRKKSQIICDARLTRLFNKPRVGHFEMLKLLESHFLIKEDSQIDKSAVDTEVGLGDDDEDYETAKRDGKDKKRKIRKKADREPQSNREDFAAIDVHNINLIYLKRKFLEDLLDDTETFNSKVVGTFVRIRIQGANNKQDIYRLVQVTGTTKGEHYAVGKKMTDTMLEILNLDKTESVSIDIISNHDFTEDECKRLRQSMKCGLIKSPKVGDILDKAIELQVVRVNDVSSTHCMFLFIKFLSCFFHTCM